MLPPATPATLAPPMPLATRWTRVVIIADDLTGALDAGVRFAADDIRVRVLSRMTDSIAIVDALDEPDTHVLVVNTRSRHLPPETAACRVLEAASAIRAFRNSRGGKILIYKKCDSTLRGNIGAELEALMSAFPETGLIFIPAFPELGRTTENGIHFVHGIPVALSGFGSDELNPVLSSSIPWIIGCQSKTSVRLHSRVQPDSAPIPGSGADLTFFPRTGEIVVPDATSDSDLDRIADRLREIGDSWAFPLLAGSAGFASRLASLCDLRSSHDRHCLFGRQSLRDRHSLRDVHGLTGDLRPSCSLRAPILAVIGSRNAVSKVQADSAIGGGYYGIALPRHLYADSCAKADMGADTDEETGAGTDSDADSDTGADTVQPAETELIDLTVAALIAGKNCVVTAPDPDILKSSGDSWQGLSPKHFRGYGDQSLSLWLSPEATRWRRFWMRWESFPSILCANSHPE